MAVHKATITIDVYGEAESADEFKRDLVGMGATSIMEEAEGGAFVAGQMKVEVETIKREDIEAEMLSIGNDGSFFDLLRENDDDEAEA